MTQQLSQPSNTIPNNNSEFSVESDRQYNRRGPIIWLISHAWAHKTFFFMALFGFLSAYICFSYARVLIGDAAAQIIEPTGSNVLIGISLTILFVLVLDGISSLASAIALEVLANRTERDARQELYTSLLGKSQTFHDQQRVGDIMARATDDVRQLNATISPGILFVFDMVLGIIVPLTFMAFIHIELLFVPIVFLITFLITVTRYIQRLDPVIQEQRMQYGVMNAGLEETVSGIEIVKVAAQEAFEKKKFFRNAKKYRDLFVRQGQIEAGYLPLLLYGIATGALFFHSLIMYNQGRLTIADIIAVFGLMGVLRFPVFVSLFSLSLLQLGVASARRILELINTESDIDENTSGYSKAVQGAITFENVAFAYDDGVPVLDNISFSVNAGETVAIVGQTGAGKSTLTQLVSRTYDATQGRVTIDGINVKEWNLDALRSQISKIEQDVFLFSRTVSENIGFGTFSATRQEIENAAKEAQAHDFILTFQDGYETKIGERGVTLSGGQRQRLALARAFLKNPRILILDDSTSAIDSATEDQIQKALRRAQQGRTTLLITHRLSQIRWADRIIVLDGGKMVANGTHESLLKSSVHYRRIFARYVELPPSVEKAGD